MSPSKEVLEVSKISEYEGDPGARFSKAPKRVLGLSARNVSWPSRNARLHRCEVIVVVVEFLLKK